ncbi:MAG: radical SAM protein [Xanthomonadales bacterium]|nr:radical SAM protein [Xanthomonadales bacterium]
MTDNLLCWADYRVIRNAGEPVLFAVEDASLFALSEEAHETLCRWRRCEFIDLDEIPLPDQELLAGLRDARVLLPVSGEQQLLPRLEPGTVPLSTLVLEVAQDCNLRCTYCYAEAGTYGAAPCLLAPDTAREAVRYLLDQSGDREQVTLVFFGGEPLLNMQAVRAATREAISYGGELGKRVQFSLTTNGTLLNAGIVNFLHEHRVSVAVSLDGPRHVHDRNRPDALGNGSYDAVVSRLGMLLEDSPAPVAARVTLAPDQWHRVVEVFDHLVGLGFHEVGIAPVSPVTTALLPTPAEETALLSSFRVLARRFVDEAKKGRILPFANILDVLGRLHLGQTKSVSCGAGFGYLALDAKGSLFPCHRLAGEADFCVGNLTGGIDTDRINSCLGSLNRGRDQSCSGCWARTLCAGGCHYENNLRENQLGLPRGTSCGFIRGWLDLGIKTYAELRTDGAIEAMSRRLAQRAQC